MWWMILGFFLLQVLFLGFAVLFVGDDADAAAIAEYERQRSRFEEMFE